MHVASFLFIVDNIMICMYISAPVPAPLPSLTEQSITGQPVSLALVFHLN